MSYAERSLALHRELKGKIELVSRAPVTTKEELPLAYTPGVAQPCLEIQNGVSLSFELTRRWNTVAVITDGTAVLGLGDIGPEAGMPVMDGKCVLFKAFGGVDAVPLCLKTKDVDEIVRTVYLLSGSFGGVNLEDIAAPRCFEIERRLKPLCEIPIFHDGQHGTAIVVLAALTKALRIVGKAIDRVSVVTSGAGAAGIAIIKLLIARGLDPARVVMTDRRGARGSTPRRRSSRRSRTRASAPARSPPSSRARTSASASPRRAPSRRRTSARWRTPSPR
jgi:malate dehydrogenase (oxaloacetate-decarboxylating)